MRKRICTLALAGCLFFTLAAPATAAEGDEIQIEAVELSEPMVAENEVPPEETAAPETAQQETVQEEAAQEIAGPHILLNGAPLALDAPLMFEDGTTYISYLPLVQALCPDASAVWAEDRAVVTAQGLEMEIFLDRPYLVANGRYLYLEDGVRTEDGLILLPIRPLCAALGAAASWDTETNQVSVISGTGPIASGEVAYQEDVLYWLSHIINAEAGNQPLDGKIAVGNVVMNRVASTLFPDTVYEVIFQRNQFTPVANGSIRKTPNAESVIAAKLVMDGANTVGSALFFMNPKTAASKWMARHRTYTTTIGQHAFYA